MPCQSAQWRVEPWNSAGPANRLVAAVALILIGAHDRESCSTKGCLDSENVFRLIITSQTGTLLYSSGAAVERNRSIRLSACCGRMCCWSAWFSSRCSESWKLCHCLSKGYVKSVSLLVFSNLKILKKPHVRVIRLEGAARSRNWCPRSWVPAINKCEWSASLQTAWVANPPTKGKHALHVSRRLVSFQNWNSMATAKLKALSQRQMTQGLQLPSLPTDCRQLSVLSLDPRQLQHRAHLEAACKAGHSFSRIHETTVT